jgi:outer membrane protein assembly factor BamE (lipoprotein component of BamABCDE complex)
MQWFIAILLFTSGNAINADNCKRIRPGMQLSDCVAVLGLPGNYATTPTFYLDAGRLVEGRSLYWMSNSSLVRIYFDSNGHVRRAECWPSFNELERRRVRKK